MKKRLTVVVQDGSIVGIISENPDYFRDVEIFSINYDCDAREDVGLVPITQPNGKTEPAFLGRLEVDRQEISFDAIRNSGPELGRS